MLLCLVKSVPPGSPKLLLFPFSMLMVNCPEPLFIKRWPCHVVMEPKAKGKTVILYLNYKILFIMTIFGINIDFATYRIKIGLILITETVDTPLNFVLEAQTTFASPWKIPHEAFLVPLAKSKLSLVWNPRTLSFSLLQHWTVLFCFVFLSSP